MSMSMTTDEELARLLAEGVPPDRQVMAAYFFSYFGASPEEARAFRDALAEAGFTGIGADTEGPESYYLHFWSYTVRRAEPNELRAAAQLAAELGEARGARLDGWEVNRLRNGELRPVDR
ncbi:MAG: ribonuclease E inhibitor RraB [Gaiellaceae bacterium]